LSPRLHPALRRYGGALLLVGAATLVRFALGTIAGEQFPLLFYLLAAVVAGWFFGVGPAIAAATVGYLLAELLFVPGPNPLYARDVVGAVQFALYLVLVVGLAAGMRSVHERHERLQRAYADLERTDRSLRDSAEDRIQIERALRESEQKFSRAFASSPVAFGISRAADGTLLDVNAAFLELVGLPRDAVIGRTLTELGVFTNPGDRVRLLDEMQAQGRVVELEIGFQSRAGENRLAALSIEPIDVGGEQCLFKILRDVTERRRAADILQRTADQLRLITDTLPMLIASVGRDHRYLWNNAAYETWFGQPRDSLAGRHMRDVLGSEAYEAIRPQVGRALAGETVQFETHLDYATGGSRDVSITYVPMHTGGEIAGMVVFVEDVTLRKRTTESLERALRELEAADRQKNEFLATLAHELRNPLAPIRYAAQLVRPDASPEALAQARAAIERQSRHMARLLDDLLDVSRITRNVVDLRRDVLDLRVAVRHSVDTLRPKLQFTEHRLEFSQPDEPLWVSADATRLAQIVDNVLENAVKYTDAGGRIEVRVSADRGAAVLRVRDSGLGIDADMRDKVFDLFAQAHTAEGDRRGGLGIGLAVVKRLVELHGGTIAVASEGLGRGSEFTIRLPRVDAPATSATAADAATPRGPARRVLVVDDNADVVLTLAAVLRQQGHDVRTARGGREALALASDEQPEVVVLDVGMPGMSGHDVARELRQRPGGDALLIVAVTGWGSELDRLRTRESGFDAHLTKPVDADDLVRIIEAAPGGRRVGSRAAPRTAGGTGAP
jgi:PAS domain S-box-containing protein